MRRPWIKIETATPDKPEICAIATTLRMDSDAVLGKLVRLWSWVEVNRVASNDLGVTKEFLDKLVGRKGFAAALIACGWLLDDDGKLGLRNLHRHTGQSAKIRALTAQRVALHRKRKQLVAESSVSEALHYEGRESMSATSSVSELNTADNVKKEDEDLGSSEKLTEPVTPGNEPQTEETVDVPQVVHSHKPATADPLTEDSAETGLDDHSPRKRRSRQSAESPDQPLLF